MADAPQSRYKVVERDRRLVVIDRWAGRDRSPEGGASNAQPAKRAWAAPIAITRTAFDGRSTLRTLALYDDNGPRTIPLDPGAAALVKGARVAMAIAVLVMVAAAFAYPVTLVIVPLALNKAVRAPIRRQLTAWLDRVAAASG